MRINKIHNCNFHKSRTNFRSEEKPIPISDSERKAFHKRLTERETEILNSEIEALQKQRTIAVFLSELTLSLLASMTIVYYFLKNNLQNNIISEQIALKAASDKLHRKTSL